MVGQDHAAAKISLVLADVDGTLVTADKVLTPRARAAVKALERAGIAFAITSGRPPRGMAMLIDPLALETPIAGFNGGDLRQARHDHHGRAHARRRCGRARRWRLSFATAWMSGSTAARTGLFATATRPMWRGSNGPSSSRRRSSMNFDEALGNAVKIVGVSDDHDLVARCEKDAQDALGNGASAARSQPYYLDVTHPDANKGTVVTTLSKLLSIPPGEIATIGDMPNDVLMFRNSGFSIAMGNASDDVQARPTRSRHPTTTKASPRRSSGSSCTARRLIAVGGTMKPDRRRALDSVGRSSAARRRGPSGR